MTDRRIWRYDLHLAEVVAVQIPRGAQVLSVATGRADATHIDLWALVAIAEPIETRRFRIVGTGHPVPASVGRYVGLVPMDDGRFIFHVFEELA